MAYCVNCGTELVTNAKFCQKCGHPTGTHDNGATRKQEFAGKIYKCPNCGEVLKSFEINCPACGYELRGAKASSAVKEFALKLEAIESKREYEKPRSLFATALSQQKLSKTDEQKISLIRSFPIPNTKEDLYEFLLLAQANINIEMYDSTVNITDSRRAVSDAWKAKFNQAYEKAKITLTSDERWPEIQAMYAALHGSIQKEKGRTWRQLGYVWAGILALFIVLIIFVNVQSSRDKEKEDARLDAIIEDICDALEAGEYKHALRIADSMDYQGYSVETEREWDIQRAYWTDKVLERAAENGVQLEYTPSSDIDNANDDPSEETPSGGFVAGFKEGIQPGLDSFKDSLNEFDSILNGEVSSANQDGK